MESIPLTSQDLRPVNILKKQGDACGKQVYSSISVAESMVQMLQKIGVIGLAGKCGQCGLIHVIETMAAL